jgi:hypothetical protein
LALEQQDGTVLEFGTPRLGVESHLDVVTPILAQSFPVCPICLSGSPSEKEHIPQYALGGRVMTMTCSACNNGLDRELRPSCRTGSTTPWSACPSSIRMCQDDAERGNCSTGTGQAASVSSLRVTWPRKSGRCSTTARSTCITAVRILDATGLQHLSTHIWLRASTLAMYPTFRMRKRSGPTCSRPVIRRSGHIRQRVNTLIGSRFTGRMRHRRAHLSRSWRPGPTKLPPGGST